MIWLVRGVAHATIVRREAASTAAQCTEVGARGRVIDELHEAYAAAH